MPLPLGGITGDIWDADLRIIDSLLADDKMIDSLSQRVRRANPKAKKTGPRTPTVISSHRPLPRSVVV